MKNLLLLLSCVFLLGCKSSNIEIGDCYYYEQNDKRKYFAVTSLLNTDNKDLLIALTPIFSSSDNKLFEAEILIENNFPGENSNAIWTPASQLVDKPTFQKLSKDFHYEGKLSISGELKPLTGLAPSDITQFKFLDSLTRNREGKKIRIEKK